VRAQANYWPLRHAEWRLEYSDDIRKKKQGQLSWLTRESNDRINISISCASSFAFTLPSCLVPTEASKKKLSLDVARKGGGDKQEQRGQDKQL
jgi:hypothetical protein